MFNSSSLDNIVERVEEVIVTTSDGYVERWSYVRKES